MTSSTVLRMATRIPPPGSPGSPRGRAPELAADPGLVVEDVETGWVGAVLRTEKSGGVHLVVLEDRHGKVRSFPLGPGFWVDGAPVRLVPPRATGPARPRRTASGSVAVHGARARTARASRILVEGRHDAELVEKVWGDDLRLEGVVVEMLDGVDDLAAAVRAFAPGPGRRLGVLVDHLVAGSKEWHEAEARGPPRRPARARPRRRAILTSTSGRRSGRSDWDSGAGPRSRAAGPGRTACWRALGWPHADRRPTSPPAGGGSSRRCDSYADLEPALLGRVEELIDFVTGDGVDR